MGRAQGWVWYVVLCAAGAQVLAGYDMGVIGGALLYIVADFQLEKFPEVIGMVMSSSLIGALIGTLAAGPTADFLGRRTTLVIAGYIFFGCGALLGWSPSITVLVAGRALLGLAIGLQSTVLPLYIAECAPALIRGSLNTMPQLAVTIGIILSYFADFFVGISSAPLWRLMLGLSCVPAAIFLVLINFPPESPRWLVKAGRKDEAARALRMLRGDDADISDELALIVLDCQHGKVSGGLEEGLLPGPELDMPLAQPGLAVTTLGGSGVSVSNGEALSSAQVRTGSAHTGSAQSGGPDQTQGVQSANQGIGNGLAARGGDEPIPREGGTNAPGGYSSQNPGALEGVDEEGKGEKDEIDSGAAAVGSKEVGEEGMVTPSGGDTLWASWRALGLGMGLKLLQELSGISVVLYYTPVVLRESGIASLFAGGPFHIGLKPAAILATACSFSMKLPAILLAFRFMDTAGRRVMLLSSIPVNIASLLTLALTSAYLEKGPLRAALSLASTSLFACAFATGLGPVPTVVISEIFPMKTRGVGQSLCFSMHWVSNIIMTEAFPILRVSIGLPWTFTMFAGLCAIAWFFVFFLMPETKGYTLEEIGRKMAGQPIGRGVETSGSGDGLQTAHQDCHPRDFERLTRS
ncbi:sugar transporter [Klebsormidium nitens]|uniref:Sugar transporter n=1 Tax=Klebsormidium nitens TaxID=105231 RepID=A0A1Y1I4I7_KLENI|nr:sugar transporter [Klebsormidium nitens]|eukprot:GAQ84081.1 sugar transporter [Klebsormidium nitens]